MDSVNATRDHDVERLTTMVDKNLRIAEDKAHAHVSLVQSIAACAQFVGGRKRYGIHPGARAPNMAHVLLQARCSSPCCPGGFCSINLYGMPGCTEIPARIFQASVLLLSYRPLVAALELEGDVGVQLLQTLIAATVCHGVKLSTTRADADSDECLLHALANISAQAMMDTVRTARERPHDLGMRTAAEQRKLERGALWFSHGLRNRRLPNEAGAAELLARLLSGTSGLTTGFNFSING